MEDDILKDFEGAISESESNNKSEKEREVIADKVLSDAELEEVLLKGKREEEGFLRERSGKANEDPNLNAEEQAEFLQWRSERERRLHKSDEKYGYRETMSVLHKKDSWDNRNLSLYVDPKSIPPNEAWLFATTKIRNEIQNENIRTLLAKDWEPLPIENFPKYKNLGNHLAKMGLQDNGTVEIGSATLMRRNIDIDNDEFNTRWDYIAQVQRSIERNTVNMGPRFGINNIDTQGEVQRSFNRDPSFARRPGF